jgi:dipicolinate synthase subunit B
LITIGFAICGSYCTFKTVFEEIERLKKSGYNIIPIMSENAYTLDTRFGDAIHWQRRLKEITENQIIHTIPQAEPIGPKKLLDALIIAPCTGNTLAKLATGVTDTAVTLAAKAHLRNGKPLIIAPSTNDALSNAAKNIGALLNYKNLYFVPFGEDNYAGKPTSMVADFSLIEPALEMALNGKQIQPIIIEPK